MKIFKKAKRGFTLVELVVVIAVIAILAAVSVGAYFGVTESANKSKLEQESKQFHTAIQTVALRGNADYTLDADGLRVSDIEAFELALEGSLGKDIEVLYTDPTYIAKQTIVLKTSELVKSEVTTPVIYRTFEYYTAEIFGKKIIIDVVTGDFIHSNTNIQINIGGSDNNYNENDGSQVEGSDGSSLLNGHGEPDSNIGKNGDTYVDLDTWDYYVKENGIWVLKDNIKGDKGEPGEPGKDGIDGEDGEDGAPGKDGTSVLTGNGIPDPTLGKNGDSYINLDTWDYYVKENDTWVLKDNIKGDKGEPGEPGKDGIDGEDGQDGAPGKDGTSVLTGNGAPDSNLGKNGDSYINLDTWDYYVKENNSWILKGNIKGENADPSVDHKGTEGLDFYPLNDSECAVAAGRAILLEKIIIPSSYKGLKVVQIGAEAFGFYNCKNLKEIIIPDTIKSINFRAFAGCNSLTTITLPDGVTSIDWSAFSECSSLTSMAIPDSVTFIGSGVFSGCNLLTSIVIPSEVEIIDSAAFSNCSNLSIYCEISSKPSTWNDNWNQDNRPVYWAGEWEYDSNGNPTPIIPDEDLNYTEGLIFDEDSVIGYEGTETDVVIPSKYNGYTITNIRPNAFSNCTSLTSIEIPNSVISIGYRAFQCCDSLIQVDLGNNVTSIGNLAFSECTSLTTIALPDSVTLIGNSAFSRCTSLTSIVIPDSVTSIGEDAFFNCTSLTSINVDNNNQTFSSLDGILYNKNKTILICCPGGKSGEVRIPDSVTSIAERSFFTCTSLLSIAVDNNNQTFSSLDGILYNKNKTILICCPGGKSGEFRIPDSVTTIKSYAFSCCSSLTSIVIPDSVTTIRYDAFYGCTSITTMVIPDSVTDINSATFAGCTSLTSIVIPDSVTSIGSHAFYGCTSLTSIVIPDSVTYIGDYALYGCISLTIYCEILAQPSGWLIFYENKTPIYWAGEWEYDSNGNPTPIN